MPGTRTPLSVCAFSVRNECRRFCFPGEQRHHAGNITLRRMDERTAAYQTDKRLVGRRHADPTMPALKRLQLLPGTQTKVKVSACGRRDFGKPALKSASDE